MSWCQGLFVNFVKITANTMPEPISPLARHYDTFLSAFLSVGA